LSDLPVEEPKKWEQLKSAAQKASLRRMAYEMTGGDVLYVKDGSRIIDRCSVEIANG